DTLDADVDDFHSKGFTAEAAEVADQRAHQCVTLAAYHFLQGALTELVTQARVDALRDELVGPTFITVGGDVVTAYVTDPPLGEVVHHHAFLFDGQETLLCSGRGENAAIKLAHFVHDGHFPV